MKVAIIGAGLSGLACAYELERHGISPTIFEKKGYIGEDYLFSTTTLRILDRTYRTSLNYLNSKYNLSLRAFTPLKEIVMVSPKQTTVVRGKLGYLFMRGEEKDSLERQFAQKINNSIRFNSFVNINDIKKDYDYIVAATGDDSIGKELNIWTSTFNVCTRVALVVGNFKIDSVSMWVDNRFSKKCYSFLAPHSLNDARILLSADNITGREMEHYWNTFLEKVQIPYKVIETKDFEYSLGYISTARVDNIYLTGNSAGLIDDFLGFGAFNAIESGLLAARSIVYKQDYNEMIKRIVKYVSLIHEFRKTINEFSNEDYDRLITFLGLPLIKQILYNNPLAKSKSLAYVAKLYNCSKNLR